MRAAHVGTIAAIGFFCAPLVCTAQSIQLEFKEGRVSLAAADAPVRDILAEWTRLRGVTVVNAEAVADLRVTLELTDVLEREALREVLREAAGYVVTSSASLSPDRILILPARVAPVASQKRGGVKKKDAARREADSLPEPLAALIRAVNASQPEPPEDVDGNAVLPADVADAIRAAAGRVRH